MATAQTRGLDFPATERAAYVRAMVKRAIDYKAEGRGVAEIRELLPEFVRDYPNLFEMVTQEEGYDRANLQTMLTMLERMGQGNLNQHQATVIVGQRLAQKYFHSVPGQQQPPQK
jgi:succinate dehydrogenase flavin-adding protein (antitoxin of CptAB toxin-antitoxin module)